MALGRRRWPQSTGWSVTDRAGYRRQHACLPMLTLPGLLPHHPRPLQMGGPMKRVRILSVATAAALVAATLAMAGGTAAAKVGAPAAASQSSTTYKPDCTDPFPLCTEVANPQEAFGTSYYVGHD